MVQALSKTALWYVREHPDHLPLHPPSASRIDTWAIVRLPLLFSDIDIELLIELLWQLELKVLDDITVDIHLDTFFTASRDPNWSCRRCTSVGSRNGSTVACSHLIPNQTGFQLLHDQMK